MVVKSKGCGERRSLGRVFLVPALTFTTLLLSALPLHAQEVIDPRTGRLFLTTTTCYLSTLKDQITSLATPL